MPVLAGRWSDVCAECGIGAGDERCDEQGDDSAAAGDGDQSAVRAESHAICDKIVPLLIETALLMGCPVRELQSLMAPS